MTLAGVALEVSLARGAWFGTLLVIASALMLADLFCIFMAVRRTS